MIVRAVALLAGVVALSRARRARRGDRARILVGYENEYVVAEIRIVGRGPLP